MSYSHIKIPVIECDGDGCEAFEEGAPGQRVIDLRGIIRKQHGWTAHPKAKGFDDLCPPCTEKRSKRLKARSAAYIKERKAAKA